MPAPLAVTLIVLMLLFVLVAIGVILYELKKAVRQIWLKRNVSAAWISAEEPGLLDYEANLLRGFERFTSELNKFTKDTQRLSKQLPKHQERIQKAAASSSARKKQKRADQAAKDIGRSAVFISRRKELLDLLVNEIKRNAKGLISAMSFDQEADVEAGRALQKTLGESVDTVTTAIDSLSKYRDAAKGIVDLNMSRTIRIESKRLMEALELMLKMLRRYNANSQELRSMLNKKITSNQ